MLWQTRQLHTAANPAGEQGRNRLDNLRIFLVEHQPHLLPLPGKWQRYLSSSHGHKQNCLRTKQEKMSVILLSVWFAYSINQWAINSISFHPGPLTWLWIKCFQVFVCVEENQPDVSCVSLRINVAIPGRATEWFFLLWVVDIKVCCETCPSTPCDLNHYWIFKSDMHVLWRLHLQTNHCQSERLAYSEMILITLWRPLFFPKFVMTLDVCLG